MIYIVWLQIDSMGYDRINEKLLSLKLRIIFSQIIDTLTIPSLCQATFIFQNNF